MMFSAATLAKMRKTQEASMMHECKIEAYTVGEDGTISYGYPIEGIRCGFRSLLYTGHNSSSIYDEIQADAELRLPLGIKVGMKDHITLTKSFGETIVPVRLFEVCNLPDSFGPSGQVVRLKEIYN